MRITHQYLVTGKDASGRTVHSEQCSNYLQVAFSALLQSCPEIEIAERNDAGTDWVMHSTIRPVWSNPVEEVESETAGADAEEVETYDCPCCEGEGVEGFHICGMCNGTGRTTTAPPPYVNPYMPIQL